MSFQPRRGANQVVTPAAASASISIDKDSRCVRLCNSGAGVCHVRIGDDAIGDATTGDVPVLPGESVVLRKGINEGTLSHISAAGTTLMVQTGEEY